MKKIRIAGLLGFCFLVGFVLVAAMAGCSSSETNDPKIPSDTTTDSTDTNQTTAADIVVPTVDPMATVGPVASVDGPESLFAFKFDDKGNPIIDGGDWAQWGGTSYRNNTPEGTDIPIDWSVGRLNRDTGVWADQKNIKWVSPVGSQTYGNPVVSGGKVLVGTNNSGGYLARYSAKTDLGVLLCFDEKTGEFLWQHSSEKLSTGRVHDWPLQGICSASYVEGDRVWFVSSRGKVVCVDLDGYYDGTDDGDIVGERARLADIRSNEDAAIDTVAPAATALDAGTVDDVIRAATAKAGFELSAEVTVRTDTAGKKWTVMAKVNGNERTMIAQIIGPKLSLFKVATIADKTEADTMWEYNMMAELEVSQHNMCNCSITALGDILFVNTSNGLDESHLNLPSPDAPSFIAMDKNTGEVLWKDGSPAAQILHGQWSSPTIALLDGVAQVIFAGGDGWVYSFKANGGADGAGELLWKFDANPKTSKWILGGRGTRNNLIATPVVYSGQVYIAVGQDPEHGEGVGHLWCIEPSKRGDVSPELAVDVASGKTIDHQRLQAVVEEDGQIARDNPNSAVIWHYSDVDRDGDGDIGFEEQMHRSCGTVAIKNDLLYISDFSGLLHCLNAQTGEVHFTYDMFAAAWGSPLIVDGHVFIGDEDGDIAIFDLAADATEPIKEINMGNSIYSTPIIANGTLFIANKTHLFAIEAPASE
jgi:outer membrane protein assembly factor BamB